MELTIALSRQKWHNLRHDDHLDIHSLRNTLANSTALPEPNA
jgi:hypothetical protein